MHFTRSAVGSGLNLVAASCANTPASSRPGACLATPPAGSSFGAATRTTASSGTLRPSAGIRSRGGTPACGRRSSSRSTARRRRSGSWSTTCACGSGGWSLCRCSRCRSFSGGGSRLGRRLFLVGSHNQTGREQRDRHHSPPISEQNGLRNDDFTLVHRLPLSGPDLKTNLKAIERR
jgi:hypothetical protein